MIRRRWILFFLENEKVVKQYQKLKFRDIQSRFFDIFAVKVYYFSGMVLHLRYLSMFQHALLCLHCEKR